jgi:hypothetical protein
MVSHSFLSEICVPPYLAELKSVLFPEPVYCESVQCAGCQNMIIRTENPMDFYDDATYCSEECLEEATTASIESTYEFEEELDEDELNDYIDSVLDKEEYGW